MADDLGEKTEDPTPKRWSEAREQGQVASSKDLASAIALLGMTVVIWVSVRHLLGQGSRLLDQALTDAQISDPIRTEGVLPFVAYIGAASVRLLAPILLAAWALGALAHVVQVGWLFTFKAVQPKLSKLNPLEGAKRLFGLSALVRATLDSLKVLVVVLVVVVTIVQDAERIVVLPQLTVMQCLAESGAMMLDLAFRVLALLLLLGIIDFLYQKWKQQQDLRMTKQEVKDELKQTDGDPEVKRRRLRMQQQIAMQRIGSAVPTADVIVTNPEHISIAIRYDPESMAAPKVVAKGADFLALRIRQIALRHGIPIVERKPLARALYRAVEVNQEIPPQFYKAVAEILAYVYRVSGRMAG